MKYKNSIFYLIEDNNTISGFTEINSNVKDLTEYLNVKKTVQLNQVHGKKVYFSDNVSGYPDGDGIILNKKNVLAVIRTADCVPLFFTEISGKYAGIIHIGWRGLHSEIEMNLIKIFKTKGILPENVFFFTGPAIEGNCYTVQHDLIEKFSNYRFADKIFKKTQNGYSMNVAKGIELSLIGAGIPKKNIDNSGICTFCNKQFPSYRRGDREKRIFNFMLIR